MAMPDRSARRRRGLRGRWRLRRQLAGIRRGLAKDARLAAKFAMFNALTRDEPASGAEPLPRLRWLPRLPMFGWPLTLLVRRRPGAKRTAWWGRAAAMVAMAAVIVGTLLLTSLMRATPTCMMLASSGTSAARAAAAASAAPAKTSQPVGGVARGPGSTCPAYPAKK